jgi:hypothetical protein
MVFQAHVQYFLPPLSPGTFAGIRYMSASHRAFQASHCHCAAPKLERSPAGGQCLVPEPNESAAREFSRGSWPAHLWRKSRPRSPRRITESSSKPDIPGILRSETITSGSRGQLVARVRAAHCQRQNPGKTTIFLNCRSPAKPSPAVETSYPAEISNMATVSRIHGS